MSPDTLRMQHPFLMALIPFVTATLIISAFIVGRWLANKKAWPFHPGGSKGFLHDEFLRLGAIFIPYAVILLGARFYIYDFHPEIMRSPYFYLALLSVFIFRRLTRYIPFVREAAKRIDTARAAAKASGEASSS